MNVKWFGREVEVSEDQWRACRRVENATAILALMGVGVLFVVGIEVSGMFQVAGLMAVLVGLVYFDGYIARWCAARKAEKHG